MAKNTRLLKPSAVFEFSFIFGVQAKSNTSYLKKRGWHIHTRIHIVSRCPVVWWLDINASANAKHFSKHCHLAEVSETTSDLLHGDGVMACV